MQTPAKGNENKNVIVFKDDTVIPTLRNLSSSVKVSPLNSARRLQKETTTLPLNSQAIFSDIQT